MSIVLKGIDYAEYFESENGFVIPVGTSVAINANGKIHEAQVGEKPIGIISAMSGVIANAYTDHWHGKYDCDNFGQIQMVKRTLTVDEIRTLYTKKMEEARANSTTRWTSTAPNVQALLLELEEAIRNPPQITEKKISSEYDPDMPYTARSERDEWNLVGLIGQMYLKKGQVTHDNWFKMKDYSDESELWLVK
jgi:hypothetical protein